MFLFLRLSNSLKSKFLEGRVFTFKYLLICVIKLVLLASFYINITFCNNKYFFISYKVSKSFTDCNVYFQCLIYVELPFREDIRQFTFGSLPITEDNKANVKNAPSGKLYCKFRNYPCQIFN